MHIILMRGLGRESGHWQGFGEKLLAKLAPFHQATMSYIDFPGCGALCKQPACRTIAQMTEHARIAAKPHLETPSPLVLIGLSMGGMVALNWAQTYPHEINRLVILNSSLGQQPWYWRFRLPALPKALVALCCPMPHRERLILNLVSNENDKQVFNKHFKQWQAIQKNHPVTRKNLITMLRCASGFKAQSTCAAKGFVIASEQDRLVSIKCSQHIAKQFDWPIIYHQTAGHDLPLDATNWLSGAICDWLNKEKAPPNSKARSALEY